MHRLFIKYSQLNYLIQKYSFGKILTSTEVEQLFIGTKESISEKIDNLFDTQLYIQKELGKIRNDTNFTFANQKQIEQKLTEKFKILQDYLAATHKMKKDLSTFKSQLTNDDYSTIYSFLTNMEQNEEYFKGIKNQLIKIMWEHHHGGEIYLRFGKYPKSERSRMGLGEEWVQELGGKRREDGVSVYKTRPVGDKWLLMDTNPRKAIYDYKGFDPKVYIDAIHNNQIYLLTGKPLKHTGSDGEVLITDVAPIKTISPDEIVFDSGKTLTEILSNYKYDFPAFKFPPGQIRNIMIGSQILSDLAESGLLTDDEYDFFDQAKSKSNIDKGDLSGLSKEELDKLDQIINHHRKQINKKLVFKGFRPFY